MFCCCCCWLILYRCKDCDSVRRGLNGVGVLLLFSDALGLLPIRRRGIHIHVVNFYYWPIVQDTGAPTTYDKPGQGRR